MELPDIRWIVTVVLMRTTNRIIHPRVTIKNSLCGIFNRYQPPTQQ